MNRKSFINSLPIDRTKKGEGRGVYLNLTLYAYPDGHGNLVCFNNSEGKPVGPKKQIDFPSNHPLETASLLMDILRKMDNKASRIRR